MNNYSMIGYIQIIFWWFFICINAYILFSDIYTKKIPNIGILALLLLAVIWLILWTIVWVWFTFIHASLCITVIIAFILFYFNLWSAWDAKYLIVLSLFLAPESIVYTVWNIALVTLAYLLLNTVYLYIIKCLINRQYCYELWLNIYNDIKDQLYVFFIDESNKITIRSALRKMIPLFVWFLIVFTAIRLVRIYLVNSYISGQSNVSWESRIWYVLQLIIEYNTYAIIILLITLYGAYKSLRYGLYYIMPYINKKVGISDSTWKTVLLILVSISLLFFIYYEFLKDPEQIKESLIRIFTFYILIWLFIKIVIYIHYITFQLWEVIYKSVKKLRNGDIVDIAYLQEIFGTQKCLWYKQETWKYSPDPSIFISQIESPISKKTAFELKQIYKTVNTYHVKQKTLWFEPIDAIKTLKSFAFAPYIFMWFAISFIYQDQIISWCAWKLVSLFLW